MKTYHVCGIALWIALLVGIAANAAAAMQPRKLKGHIVIPSSSIERPGDRGRRMHTNVSMFVPDEKILPAAGGGNSGTAYAETLASLACVYKLVRQIAGCDPAMAQAIASGGSRAIAVVDAFDSPSAAADLATFSSTFGLPAGNLRVVYATGQQPIPGSGGWQVETSLDIEMAHAMAPAAEIYLVEAASDADADLFAAVTVAGKLVAAAGGGEVSMSWSSSEWTDEVAYDSLFTTAKVVYLAATGDSPGTGYPSVSPNVIAVGGTTLRRDAVSGSLFEEDAWNDGGGGESPYEPRPSYQAAVASVVGSQRGVPDVAATADPNIGVWIYAGCCGGFAIVGGTSVATPLFAGIINHAGSFATSTEAELTTIYDNMSVTTDFLDIKGGYCGPYSGDAAGKGWDFCTGVGSPVGLRGK